MRINSVVRMECFNFEYLKNLQRSHKVTRMIEARLISVLKSVLGMNLLRVTTTMGQHSFQSPAMCIPLTQRQSLHRNKTQIVALYRKQSKWFQSVTPLSLETKNYPLQKSRVLQNYWFFLLQINQH